MGSASRPRSFAPVGLAAVILAAATAACGGEAEKTEKAGKAEEQALAEVPAVDAAAFYREYSGLKGAILLERYSAGVVVTGAVVKVVDLGGDEGRQLWLAVDGPGHIAVKFQDGGADARKKKIQAGEIVSVACQINGKPADVLFLVSCALR
jgi:hypothetical protein